MFTKTTNRCGIIGALFLTGLLGACADAASDHIIGIDATGVIHVILFLDNDLNNSFNANIDRPIVHAQVDLRMHSATGLLRGGITDSSGVRVFEGPIGRYSVVVDSTVLGDSLEVGSGTNEITIRNGDSVGQLVGLKYRTYSAEQARTLPTTRRGWVRGVVINSPNTFGDSTVHIHADSGTAAIRIVGEPPNFPIIFGDTAVFLGRRTVRDGQPAFMVTTPGIHTLILGAGAVVVPDSLTTLVAGTADGGARDARFTKVAATTVSDTATVQGNRVMTVSDGSGPLTVLLLQSINFGTTAQLAAIFKPGAKLDITGVLVPDPTDPGRWMLKPRTRSDIVVLP